MVGLISIVKTVALVLGLICIAGIIIHFLPFPFAAVLCILCGAAYWGAGRISPLMESKGAQTEFRTNRKGQVLYPDKLYCRLYNQSGKSDVIGLSYEEEGIWYSVKTGTVKKNHASDVFFIPTRVILNNGNLKLVSKADGAESVVFISNKNLGEENLTGKTFDMVFGGITFYAYTRNDWKNAGITPGCGQVPSIPQTAMTNPRVLTGNSAVAAAKKYGQEKSSGSFSDMTERLQKEGYSAEQAKAGALQSGTDWNQRALETARNLMKYGSYSSRELQNLVEKSGFSQEQAAYAVKNFDWNQQAYESARRLLEKRSYSADELKNSLISAGFTKEQAAYAVKKVGGE